MAFRRREILSRQAKEIGGLDAEQADVERLGGMVDDFVRKFSKPSLA